MRYLLTEATTEECGGQCLPSDDGNAHGYVDDGNATVRISNPAAENGEDQEPGPLSWLNSARITTDPEDDAVHCVVSVGDPRGGFCFTVRRLRDGRLVIHTPHPKEGMPHCGTWHERDDAGGWFDGTLVVGDWRRNTGNNTDTFHAGDYSDPDPEPPEGVEVSQRDRFLDPKDPRAGFYWEDSSGDSFGPFPTRAEAIADARETVGD